jgi:hypothetical protein
MLQCARRNTNTYMSPLLFERRKSMFPVSVTSYQLAVSIQMPLWKPFLPSIKKLKSPGQLKTPVSPTLIIAHILLGVWNFLSPVSLPGLSILDARFSMLDSRCSILDARFSMLFVFGWLLDFHDTWKPSGWWSLRTVAWRYQKIKIPRLSNIHNHCCTHSVGCLIFFVSCLTSGSLDARGPTVSLYPDHRDWFYQSVLVFHSSCNGGNMETIRWRDVTTPFVTPQFTLTTSGLSGPPQFSQHVNSLSLLPGLPWGITQFRLWDPPVHGSGDSGNSQNQPHLL